MKVLLDACVWGRAQIELRSSGHDVVWAGEWESDPGDEEILRRAAAEQRVLVTLDKDFGELAIVQQVAHHGILSLAFPLDNMPLYVFWCSSRAERNWNRGPSLPQNRVDCEYERRTPDRLPVKIGRNHYAPAHFPN